MVEPSRDKAKDAKRMITKRVQRRKKNPSKIA
jgi:hypothetical protein